MTMTKKTKELKRKKKIFSDHTNKINNDNPCNF